MTTAGDDWADAQRSLAADGGPAPEAAADFAGWGARVAAFLLDTLLLVVVLVGGGALVGALVGGGGDISATEGGLIAGYAAYFLLGWLYFAVSEARPRGQTLGKRALGIAVRAADGGPAAGKAFGRELIRVVFGFVPVLPIVDALWPLWDRNKQSLHDKAVDTIVVRARPPGGAG